MRKTICEHQYCTGCSSCKEACPKHCITMKPDELDAIYPVIDEEACVDCGVCSKTCPNNLTLNFNHPQKVYAAWSLDSEIRRTSASGGIAYELYKYWLRHNGVAAGVVYDKEDGCHFILIEREIDIDQTRNSKYTFSNTSGIYRIIKERLASGVPVLFIGVPCQVAGLIGYLKKQYDNLTTVDLICHGMAPEDYLKQHINTIERRNKEKTKTVVFRDPLYETRSYTFTLRNQQNKEFYRKPVLSFDNYQLAFHKSLCYRENCYNCKYAKQERISDLTIGDFSGLGRVRMVNYERRNVSCILQNTSKGATLLRNVADTIFLDERPPEEAFLYEHQLQSPSAKHPKRALFEEIYSKEKDFEKAASKSLISAKVNVTRVLLRQRVRSIFVALKLKK